MLRYTEPSPAGRRERRGLEVVVIAVFHPAPGPVSPASRWLLQWLLHAAFEAAAPRKWETRKGPPTCVFALEWAGADLNHRRLRRQIYSLLPLATRAPTQEPARIAEPQATAEIETRPGHRT